MDVKIPGLTPIWVIDFIGPKRDIPPTPFKSLIEISEQCRKNTKAMQNEISNLHNTIDQFKEMLEEYYNEGDDVDK